MQLSIRTDVRTSAQCALSLNSSEHPHNKVDRIYSVRSHRNVASWRNSKLNFCDISNMSIRGVYRCISVQQPLLWAIILGILVDKIYFFMWNSNKSNSIFSNLVIFPIHIPVKNKICPNDAHVIGPCPDALWGAATIIAHFLMALAIEHSFCRKRLTLKARRTSEQG